MAVEMQRTLMGVSHRLGTIADRRWVWVRRKKSSSHELLYAIRFLLCMRRSQMADSWKGLVFRSECIRQTIHAEQARERQIVAQLHRWRGPVSVHPDVPEFSSAESDNHSWSRFTQIIKLD